MDEALTSVKSDEEIWMDEALTSVKSEWMKL